MLVRSLPFLSWLFPNVPVHPLYRYPQLTVQIHPLDEVPIDECPEFVLLSEKLVDVAVPPETVVMNGHYTYYNKLPSDFPAASS